MKCKVSCQCVVEVWDAMKAMCVACVVWWKTKVQISPMKPGFYTATSQQSRVGGLSQ